jgi:hypothetical protein
MIFVNATDAIRTASHDTECCAVAYRQGDGWFTYDPRQGCPANAEPEFLCFAGRLPLPLSETAIEVLFSALNAAQR